MTEAQVNQVNNGRLTTRTSSRVLSLSFPLVSSMTWVTLGRDLSEEKESGEEER
jgi:hypothetical protein